MRDTEILYNDMTDDITQPSVNSPGSRDASVRQVPVSVSLLYDIKARRKIFSRENFYFLTSDLAALDFTCLVDLASLECAFIVYVCGSLPIARGRAYRRPGKWDAHADTCLLYTSDAADE